MGSQHTLTGTRIQRKMAMAQHVARTGGSTSTRRSAQVMISLVTAYTETDTARATREMVVIAVTMEMQQPGGGGYRIH
jgi:hypothetical protein